MSSNNKEERIARLSAVSKQKKQDALNTTEKAILKLQEEGKAITFKSVAREARVSTSYLYKYPEIKDKISKLREEEKYRVRGGITVISDKFESPTVEHLKRRIKDLEQEIIQLGEANEFIGAKVSELEEHKITVKTLRKQNEKLSEEIEILIEKNTELKNKLARRTLKPKNKIKPTKRPCLPIPESVKLELKNLNIKINSTLKKVIRENPEEVVLESINSLKYAIEKNGVTNPSGFLVKAIKNRWKEPQQNLRYSQDIPPEYKEDEPIFPEGFEEWFIKAIDSGFIINESPIDLLENPQGELLVKVNRPSASGLSYCQMSWIEAKKLMDLDQ